MELSFYLYLVIAFIVGLIIKSYIPSYFKKKGENLATKEDIELITDKIESVRSSIEIARDAHKELISERKKSLIDFYDEVTSFHYEIIAVNFGDFPMDEGKSLYEYQLNFYKSVATTLKLYQRIVIFNPPNSILMKKANLITTDIINCREIFKENFGEIKTTSIEEQRAFIMNSSHEIYKAAVMKANVANENYWNLIKPSVESFRDHYQEYLSNLNEYFSQSELNA